MLSRAKMELMRPLNELDLRQALNFTRYSLLEAFDSKYMCTPMGGNTLQAALGYMELHCSPAIERRQAIVLSLIAIQHLLNYTLITINRSRQIGYTDILLS